MKLKTLFLIIVISLPLANLLAQGNDQNFKIGILLPFSTDGSDKANKNAEAIFDYYQGAKLALNQLEKEGFKSTVQVWDLNKDSLELEKLFKSTDFQGLDLLIGPISQKYVTQISKRLKNSNITWVSPLKSLNLPNSQFNLNFFSPDSLRMRGLGYALSDQFKFHKYCLITDGSSQSRKDANTLKFVLQSLSKSRKISIHQFSGTKFTPPLPMKDSVICINTFSNQTAKIQLVKYATGKVNDKKNSPDRYTTYVVGHFNWYENLSLSQDASEDKIIYPAINFLNQADSSTAEYTKLYVEKNYGEPSRFAYQGFDQMLFLGYGLMFGGKSFLPVLPNSNNVGFINTIRPYRIGKRFYNIGVRLISLGNHDQKLFTN
jgi:hypothetical protein